MTKTMTGFQTHFTAQKAFSTAILVFLLVGISISLFAAPYGGDIDAALRLEELMAKPREKRSLTPAEMEKYLDLARDTSNLSSQAICAIVHRKPLVCRFRSREFGDYLGGQPGGTRRLRQNRLPILFDSGGISGRPPTGKGNRVAEQELLPANAQFPYEDDDEKKRTGIIVGGDALDDKDRATCRTWLRVLYGAKQHWAIVNNANLHDEVTLEQLLPLLPTRFDFSAGLYGGTFIPGRIVEPCRLVIPQPRGNSLK